MIVHSSGRWTIIETQEHWGRINCTVVTHEGKCVATAWQLTTEENRANARVIASAPDLLDIAIKYEQFWATRENELGSLSEEAHELRKLNREVIYRATGEYNEQ